MNQKTALIISAGITSFILVIGGGAAAIANRASAAGQTTSVQPGVIDTPATTLNGNLASQREAQYMQLIDQANSQIRQANVEITSLKAQLKQAQSPTVSQTQPVVENITSNQAQKVALNAVPGAIVTRVPDLVNYQGTLAYEVVLDQGTLYIDAKTSAILANGAATLPATTFTGVNHQESGKDD
jgi:uncharacterized membrane protein YkoI